MKLKNFLSILPLFLMMFLMSCRSKQINTLSTPMYDPVARINEIRAKVSVDMNKKLTGEANAAYFLIFRLNGDSNFATGMSYSGDNGLSKKYAKLKSAAAYKAINGSEADIIVHPNYVISIERFLFFKKVTVTVSGYAGKFTKFYQTEYCDPCILNKNNDK